MEPDCNVSSVTISSIYKSSPKDKRCTVKKIRRFYGKVTGNQLPVHFHLFLTDARKHFQESGTER